MSRILEYLDVLAKVGSVMLSSCVDHIGSCFVAAILSHSSKLLFHCSNTVTHSSKLLFHCDTPVELGLSCDVRSVIVILGIYLTLWAHSACKRHETFSFMMSLPAMSFGDKFCFSRKG